MPKTVQQRLQEFTDQMLDAGYAEEGPHDIQAYVMDMQVAIRDCPNCGSLTSYRPFVKGQSYRAFSICFNCGEIKEF